jgi:RimJ/RimL family protein N-acetyltransferase
MPPEIVRLFETERLSLRRFIADDAAFVLALFNDPDFVRFVGDRGVRRLVEARAWIADRFLPHYETGGTGPFVVELKASLRPIGFCSLFRREWLDEADLGFAFLPEHRAKGYAFEAAAALMEYARSVLGLVRLRAIASVDNAASARLLARLGFTDIGLIRPPDEAEEVRLYSVDL